MSKQAFYRLSCWITLAFFLTTGCGQKQEPAQDKQSGQQNDKPIDSQLQQQMKMYQEIQQQEYELLDKKRASEKKQLKELQKTQEKALQHEIDFQKKLRRSGNPWAKTNKNNGSSGGSQQSGDQQSEDQQNDDQQQDKKAKILNNPLRDAKKSE